MKRPYFAALLTFAVVAGLLSVLALSLKNSPEQLDLVVKNDKIPVFSLPQLLSEQPIENSDLRTNQGYYLLNFWGSWCPACYTEQPFLMQLRRSQTIYGVNWRDDHQQALQFIGQYGNPFAGIIVDAHSQLAINMGVYGAPETYLITADHTIVYRHAGPLDQRIWAREFLPRIAKIHEKADEN